MRRTAAAVAPVVLLALLAGCGTSPSVLPDGVSVSIRQNRDDYGPRRLEVLVANGTDAALDVWEARLDSPAFIGAAWTPEPSTVRAGTTTALRLQLPEPDCGGDASETPGGGSPLPDVLPGGGLTRNGKETAKPEAETPATEGRPAEVKP